MEKMGIAIFGCAVALLAAPAVLAHGTSVEVGHNRISPAEVTIGVGDVVHFVNQDEMPGGHTIVADGGAFESPALGKGESWHHTFAEPGTYVYRVKQHPGATGKIVVVEKKPSPASPPTER